MTRSGMCVVWVAVLVVTAGVALAADVFYIQVRTCTVRAKPTYVGSVMGRLPYGYGVNVLEERGPWRRIQTRSGSGWLHVSVLSEDRLEPLSAGTNNADGGASAEEVALAGKGFTEQIEREWRQQHGNAGYGWVDRMKGFVVPDARVAEFLAAGEVSPGEGGGP